MSPEYRSYLAAGILSEERVITYRLLSRALKVHVNTAKQMLFEFHRQQNGKKPGTVHATYLIAGTKRKPASPSTNGNGTAVKDGEDEYMQSSPFRSSPVPNLEEFPEDFQSLSLTLVKEESLNEVRSMYQTITAVHVYSLAPYNLKDLQVLSDTARETAEIQINQHSLEVSGNYGTIINKAARRRNRRVTLSAAIQGHTDAAHLSSQPGEVKKGRNANVPDVNLEPKASQSTKDILKKSSFDRTNVPFNSPHPKRDTSNIFQSFAKVKPPLRRERTDSSAGASGLESTLPSELEDETMKDTSDGEEDEYIPPPNSTTSKGAADTDRNSRKVREAALKKMMEDDEDESEESDVAQLQQHPESSKDSPASEPAEEAVLVSGGRRRGRRRVMKKKTVKDEEGYLVTREEPAWESFSEEEPTKTKSKPSSSMPSSSDKSKKGSAKAGQGSIMSFFGKK